MSDPGEMMARLKAQLDEDTRVATDDPARALREVDALRRMITAYETSDAMAAEAAAKLDAGNEAVRTDWLTACARAGALRDALRVLAKARYGDFPEWTL